MWAPHVCATASQLLLFQSNLLIIAWAISKRWHKHLGPHLLCADQEAAPGFKPEHCSPYNHLGIESASGRYLSLSFFLSSVSASPIHCDCTIQINQYLNKLEKIKQVYII